MLLAEPAKALFMRTSVNGPAVSVAKNRSGSFSSEQYVSSLASLFALKTFKMREYPINGDERQAFAEQVGAI